MPLYSYEGYTKNGKKEQGILDAGNKQAAKEMLSKIGILATSIDLAKQEDSEKSFFKSLFAPKISLKDKIFFTKQLSVLLKSGIPLLQSLDLLVEQSEGKLKSIVIRLRDKIKEGGSLADALQKYSNVFDNIYIQLVKAGEASGKLEVILDRLNEYLERSDTIKRKISSALQYPLIQLVVILLVVVGLLTLVFPQISEFFIEANLNLPIPTKILIGLSNFLIKNYIFLILAIIGIIVGFKAWSRTEKGSKIIDAIKLKLPIVGYFTKFSAIVQFCRTLGMLIEAKVNLAQALDIVVNIVENKVLTDSLDKARENIIKQGKIAPYLKSTEIFPPVAIYLINTGEQSGQLDTMLLTVGKYYEDELLEKSESLSSLLGPIMLLFMGITVGFIMLSMMMPVFKIMNKFGEIS